MEAPVLLLKIAVCLYELKVKTDHSTGSLRKGTGPGSDLLLISGI